MLEVSGVLTRRSSCASRGCPARLGSNSWTGASLASHSMSSDQSSARAMRAGCLMAASPPGRGKVFQVQGAS